ncbi:39S ribosomal protein L39, mitochondrial [Fopius arisanus]|uniref:Large ribosomal subunit protein mL39 n=1 Tax=Fopius arisanus TaxID=64838 RepID=A0A9R1TMU1_9HYME|nr:PREDICTED: 39S ribosomal protein L39, mitochondrial [Fopius arisanus]
MIQGYKTLCCVGSRLSPVLSSRFASTLTKPEAKKNRNDLFESEKRRQVASVGRIEKIKVIYHGPEDEITLLMNKDLSTPHDCAMHISDGVTKTSALASVDGAPWDLHKPLVSDCNLILSSMRTPNDRSVNNAFWRTCSLMLGAVVDSAFKDDIPCHLHSFTSPNIKSGSFIYDVHLELPDWNPTEAELRSLSSLFTKLIREELPIERLEIGKDMALEMFQENPFKTKQIPNIAQNNEGKIVVYRVGDHIDISKGPMIGNTRLVGRCTIGAIHKIQNDAGENLHRFQGVALPSGIIVNHVIYGLMEERAKKFNQTVWMPQRLDHEDSVAVAANN